MAQSLQDSRRTVVNKQKSRINEGRVSSNKPKFSVKVGEANSLIEGRRTTLLGNNATNDYYLQQLRTEFVNNLHNEESEVVDREVKFLHLYDILYICSWLMNFVLFIMFVADVLQYRFEASIFAFIFCSTMVYYNLLYARFRILHLPNKLNV